VSTAQKASPKVPGTNGDEAPKVTGTNGDEAPKVTGTNGDVEPVTQGQERTLPITAKISTKE
jgi:hypothetical protein